MAMISRRHFFWQENNHFQLLVDGGEFFPAMLSSIRSAKSQILLEMYLVISGTVLDQFIVALSDAAKRGVQVYVLFDDYGARGMNVKDRQRITRAGIHFALYNPIRFGRIRRNLWRDHRKLLVVDEQQAFVGGMGLADMFDIEVSPQGFWHDVAVRAVGPVVADWHNVFRHNWERWGTQQLTPTHVAPVDTTDERSGQAGRVAGGQRFGALRIHRSFLKHVRNAERRVWVMTAYFVPSRSMLRAFRKAAKRGVDVRLLLPGSKIDHPSVRYAGHQYYYSLLCAGVRIFEYQPRFLHAKVLMCDDWVSIGSSNVDRWNLRWNLEANQEVENSDFALRVSELFSEDLAESKEHLLSAWEIRPRYRRVLEWFWGKVAQQLERISIRIRRKRK